MFYIRRLFIFLFLVLISTIAFGQLYINEFMASNSSTINDPDYNNDADWIELYNDGNTAIDLSGFYLTDNLKQPDKWKIGKVSIAAKGYVLFWADGMNTGNHTSFNLNALNEEIGLYKHDLFVIDTIHYSYQKPDISSGRKLNNLTLWGYFSEPTPNAANSTEFFSDIALNEPIFSIRGGLYNTDQSITLYTDLGGEIRFTLDGSAPGLSSETYTIPIDIYKTTVVRARVFKPEMIPGPVITNTYFINENMDARGLPVVSMASDPENFWDPQKGIYVQTFKPDWEIPVNIELFENNKSDRAAFNEMAGVKINGLYSWQLPQKMLGVYFKNQYGKGTLDNTLFYDSPRSSFKTFALRASGNDWSNTLMRDIVAQNATQLNMNLDISAFRWCIVYINGKYMGIHNFREKIETDYIEKHYGLAAGTFDMVENQDYAECGDLNAYNNLITLFSKDLSIQSNFDAVAEKIDIDNFTDLVITEIACGNSSIDHNVMAWKPKDNGKWKWILMDLDRGFFEVNNQLISFYLGQRSFPFGNLMKNTTYQSQFGQKLADHLYTSFHPVTMKKLINTHHDIIAPEIQNHVERWLGTTSSYGDAMPSVAYWNNEVEKLNSFVEERPSVILNDLKNYGFSGSALLALSVSPEYAGTLKLNSLTIPYSNWIGPYLLNVSSIITTEEKAGFTFKGWAKTVEDIIIPKQSVWRYLDNGSNLGTDWTDSSFNDQSWKSGQAELGYGDGDEKTVVSYGPDARNKFITTYFRHSFELTESEISGTNFIINLLKDDGAIVYLNRVEIIRDNMASGKTEYKTFASTAVSGASEALFKSFIIDKSILRSGKNVLAVEVHQSGVTSSDISFDLELIRNITDKDYVSTEKSIPITLAGNLSLIAVYESTTECRIPDVIATDMTLHKNCSPYVVPDDVTIISGVTLTVEPGVEIWMSPQSDFFIQGNIKAIGTPADRITFKINPEYEPDGWGALNFWNTSDTSFLYYVTVDDATRGPVPERVGAISGYYTTLKLDHLIIDKTHLNPISSRYSDVTLTNSYIHSSVTGDLINIKYGKGRIENCTFIGNSEFDSDGIDYDGITNGVISNTKIYNILGINADAIDIGEEAINVIIDSVSIYNAFDKGVSVGQRSSVVLTNSYLINCNIGLGIKDSSKANIDHCIFYGNGVSVDCYEKNPGQAGGNAIVKNSILSNTYVASYQADDKSTMEISYSISDNTILPSDPTNLFGNVLFTDPTHQDFSLQKGSPGIGAGYENDHSIDLGAKLPKIEMEPDVLICQMYLNPLNSINPEYLALINPSFRTIDMSNYSIDKGITCIFPQGTIMAPGDTLFITEDASGWNPGRQVVQWTSGKLSNEGEAIEVLNQFGMVADFIEYFANSGWPEEAFNSETVLSLISSTLDNHFPENWKAIPLNLNLAINDIKNTGTLRIYPNPARDQVRIIDINEVNSKGEIYSSIGQLVRQIKLDYNGQTILDVSNLKNGLYLIKVGKSVVKMIILK